MISSLDHPRRRILLADADHDLFTQITLLLEEIAPRRFVLEWASTYGFAVSVLRRQQFDLCMVGSHIGHRSGTELVRHLRATSPRTPALLFVAHEEIGEAADRQPVECLDRHRLTVEMLRQAIRDLLFRPAAGAPGSASLTHPAAAEAVYAQA